MGRSTLIIDRSSHQRCSVKKGVLKNFAKSHRKTPVPESKVTGLRKLVAGIKLVEGNKLLHEDTEVVKELNNFFKEAASTSDVNKNSYIINLGSINFSSPIEKVSINFIQEFYSLMTR